MNRDVPDVARGGMQDEHIRRYANAQGPQYVEHLGNYVVGIDAQLTLGTSTGIGEYVQGLLHAFSDVKFPVQLLRDARFDPWRFDRRVLWDQILLPLAARKCELIHCTAGTMPLLPPRPTIVTVHDIAWLRVQNHARAYARTYFGKMMLQAYRRAARVIVVSAFAKAEFLAFVDYPPERIDVIFNGVDPAYADIIRPFDGTERSVDAPFILCPGTVEKRKNLTFLIRAVAAMRSPGIRLFAPGPHTPYVDECRRIAQECGVADRVDMPGYIDRATLLQAYSSATVLASPSTYEGFGYAAAQGLCAGLPVIVSADGALAEITGEHGTVLPLDDLTAWARALDEHFENAVYTQTRAAGYRIAAAQRFSWNTAAKQTISAYRSAMM